MSPQEAAQQRLAAIAALQEQLANYLTEADRRLYEGLLARLQETLDQPELLPSLLAEFTQLVHLPIVLYYGQSLLTLPAMQLRYFSAIDGATNYAVLRAPLQSFLEKTFGITADGTPTKDGYLSTLLNDTGINRTLLHYAYQSQASGLGLEAYREGLEDLVLGQNGNGLFSKLYKEAADTYNQADRALQNLAANELGLNAFLYQGGLIDSSRAFCIVRNGKVFLREEIARFGTSKDTYGGYTNKKEGMFSGKIIPYDPFVMLGGFSCRHGLHALSNTIALSLRADLTEDSNGKLVLKTD